MSISFVVALMDSKGDSYGLIIEVLDSDAFRYFTKRCRILKAVP